MKKRRRFFSILLANVFFFLVFSIFIINLADPHLMGNVILSSESSECNEDFFSLVWDQTFLSDSSLENFSKLEDIEQKTCELSGFNLEGDTILFLKLYISEGISNKYYSLYSITGKLTNDAINSINNLNPSEETLDELLSPTDFIERDPFLDIDSAENLFLNYFNTTSTLYDWQESTSGNFNSIGFKLFIDSESNSTGEKNIIEEGILDVNFSMNIYSMEQFNILNETYYKDIILLKNLSNFEFLMGSSWTDYEFLEDLSSNTLNLSFESNKIIGNGTLLFRKNDDGIIQFMAQKNGWGIWNSNLTFLNDGPHPKTLEFKITIRNNTAPIIIQDFETFFIDVSKKTFLDLRDYFKDPEGLKLNYTIETGQNISYNLSDYNLEIIPKEGWTGKSWIKIIATDGNLETSSGTLNVWVSSIPPSKEFSNKTFNSSHSNNSSKLVLLNFTDETILYSEKLNSTIVLFVEVLEREGIELTYSWFINDEKLSQEGNFLKLENLDKGDYQVKVQISDGQEILEKTWNLQIENSSNNLKTILLLSALTMFIIGITISIFIVVKDLKKQNTNPPSQEVNSKFSQNDNIPFTGTDKKSEATMLEKNNISLDPVKDYLDRLYQ